MAALVLVSGCDPPGQPKLADKPVAADKLVDFSGLYRRNCAGCHGTDGKLGPAPPLNDAVFLTIVPDSELLHVISDGRPGTPMPAFSAKRGGPLTDAQVRALAAGIKPQWGTNHSDPATFPPYSMATTGDKKRGAKVFARACASCHGSSGEGSQTGEQGAGAINDPAFLALISDQALRRLALTGRPDLGMPGYADKSGRSPDYQPMTSAEIGDLVTFLASWRQADRRISSSRGP